MADTIIDVVENPYHRAETKPHYLDVAEAKLACFDVFNIIAASQSLGGEYELGEPDEDHQPSRLFQLHQELAEPRLSQLLPKLAVFVRTFDDVMMDVGGDAYAAHAAATAGVDFIGNLEGGPLTLREACNKIIHAVDFRPVYDRAERQISDNGYLRVWYMTGAIEIGGMQGGKHWNALLNVHTFLDFVINRIAFEPAVQAANHDP